MTRKREQPNVRVAVSLHPRVKELAEKLKEQICADTMSEVFRRGIECLNDRVNKQFKSNDQMARQFELLLKNEVH